MSEPANLPTPPTVTPYLTVDDSVAAVRFYEQAFGARPIMRQATPDGSKTIHAAISIGGGLVMMSDDFSAKEGGKGSTPRALGGTAVTIALNLPDVDATWATALAAGAKVVMPLADMFWGDRYGILEDPFGHRWSLSTTRRKPTQADLDAGAQKHFG